jgi:phospholipid transport system substrate-binding protein
MATHIKMPESAKRSAIVAALAVVLCSFSPVMVCAAAPTDAAAARIDTFDHALIEVMKGGTALGVKGRARKIAPAVDAAFDLATMTRFAVGPKWSEMTAAQRDALSAAFGRLTVASYARNFDSFSGERFDLDPIVQVRGPDKIVQCKLIPPHDKPVALLYRMRQTAAGWKIIDVYYDGISQLTTRRADFTQPLAVGGAAGLLSHLDTLTEKLLK